MDIIPFGWLAARKEFFVDGLTGPAGPFAFEATHYVQRYSTGEDITVLAAKCALCAGITSPDRESMERHAKLHVVIDLSRK